MRKKAPNRFQLPSKTPPKSLANPFGGRVIYPVFAALRAQWAKGRVAGEGVMSTSSLSTFAGTESMRAVIDEDHLGRMTLGDCSLEREVLAIFVRQTTLMLKRIAGAEPAIAAAAAHTLKGSARGIGAWRVARAAERLEEAAGGRDGAEAVSAAMAELEAASLEACAAIGTRPGHGLSERSPGALVERPHDH